MRMCQGWDSAQRKAALAEAEARGELHVEGDKIVFHSLMGAMKHMSEVFARRPELADFVSLSYIYVYINIQV